MELDTKVRSYLPIAHRFDIHLSSETIEYASISDVQVKIDPEDFRGYGTYTMCE